jgi:hypothetical protein
VLLPLLQSVVLGLLHFARVVGAFLSIAARSLVACLSFVQSLRRQAHRRERHMIKTYVPRMTPLSRQPRVSGDTVAVTIRIVTTSTIDRKLVKMPELATITINRHGNITLRFIVAAA